MALFSDTILVPSHAGSSWDSAFELVEDENLRLNLKKAVRIQKRDILVSAPHYSVHTPSLGITDDFRQPAVLQAVNDRQQECIQRKWKFKKENGEEIIIRDLLEKIAGCVRRFPKDSVLTVDDDAINDSFPWAVIRFLLRAAASDTQEFGARINLLEVISRLISIFHDFEPRFMEKNSSETPGSLIEARTRLNAELLIQLGTMVGNFKANGLVVMMKVPLKWTKTSNPRKDCSTVQAACFDLPSSQMLKYCKSLNPQSTDFVARQPYLGSGNAALCSVVVDDLITTSVNHPTAAPFAYLYCASQESESRQPSADHVMRTILEQLAFDRGRKTRLRHFLWSHYERQSALARASQLSLSKLGSQDCVQLILEMAEQESLIIVINAIDHIRGNNRYTLLDSLKRIVVHSGNVVKVFVSSSYDDHISSVLVPNETISLTTSDFRQDMGNCVEDVQVERHAGPPEAGFFQGQSEPQQVVSLAGTRNQVKATIKKAIEDGHIDLVRSCFIETMDPSEMLPDDAVTIGVLFGHTDVVELLLDQGLSIEAEGETGSPLVTASLLNHEALVLLLLRRGADVNASGKTGTALHIAAAKGHLSIMKLLIQGGAAVNQTTGFYRTALRAAASLGRLQAVKLLLNAGAKMNPGEYSEDAFYAAIERGHLEVVRLMLAKGYRFRHFNEDWVTCTLSAAPSRYRGFLRDASPEPKDRLSRRHGPDTNQTSTVELTIELRNVFGGYRDSCSPNALSLPEKTDNPQVLLSDNDVSGFDNSVDYDSGPDDADYPESDCSDYHYLGGGSGDSVDRRAPLEEAAFFGREDVVDVLLGASKTLDISDKDIVEAARVAAKRGCLLVVERLLEHVATRRFVDSSFELVMKAVLAFKDKNPLMVQNVMAIANRYCSSDQFSRLKMWSLTDVQKYEQVNDISAQTAERDFLNACEHGNLDLVAAIVESRHFAKIQPNDLSEGLQLSAVNGQTRVAELLLGPVVSEEEFTISDDCLIGAAAQGDLTLVRLLASRCQNQLSNPNLVGRMLIHACEQGNADVVRYLVEELSADVNETTTDMPLASLPRRLRTHRESPSMSLGSSPLYSPASSTAPEFYISPLQAAIRAFKVLEDPDEWMLPSKDIDHKQHEAVIKILLDNRADPDDLGGQRSYPIQAAAELCPKPVVKLLIEAGADLNLAGRDGSSLFRAAGRELAAAEILNMLLEEGADIPSDEADIRELLDQALRYFVGEVSRNRFNGYHADPDGRFVSSPSLEHVFKNGPGAVLRILLTVFPHLRATNEEYGLVLQMAAFLNDHIFVDLLISRGVDVNAPGYHYGTSLQAASRWGHEDMVMRLLQAGAQVNFLQGRWQTALRAAIAGGNEQVVRILLEHGADIQLAFKTDSMAFAGRESSTQTALQLAVRTDKVGVVQILLAAGADASGDESATLQDPKMMVDQHPLILSCQQGNAAMVHALLDAGAPVNVTGTTPPWHAYFDAESASPLHAAVKAEHTHIVQLLLSRGANVDKTVNECFSALILAAKSGQRAITRLLIEAKANVNYVADSSTALTFAIGGGHLEIVQDLLAAGTSVADATGIPNALVGARGRSEDTRGIELLTEAILSIDDPGDLIEDVFSEAIRYCNLRMIGTLLEYVPATKTRFFQACTAGFAPFVKRMLETGIISLNEPGDEGNSPLCVSALHLKPAIVRLLVGRGAELNSIGDEFGTPLMIALTSCAARRLAFPYSEAAKKLSSSLQIWYDNTWVPGEDSRIPRVGSRSLRRCEEIVGTLLDNGAGLGNVTGPFGPPLHLACLTGSKTVVQRILGEGADVNETGGYFQHALFAASAIQRADIVAVLLEHGASTRIQHQDFGSPLHLASKIADIASVQELLRHGANVLAADADGRSPREVAASMMEARQQWKGDHTKLRFRDDLLFALCKAEGMAVTQYLDYLQEEECS
ncbi:hypothetical protein QQZ08_009655 [Neonectria magnoliae]|uniref:Nephrocystin 3-like N-terminal domain-containing protein n=1 Tax=Neonectria magnoliae TaxID=2732573 RepID=A0ABR1HM19_9HYPO